jgi:uncharacterized protein YukE
MDRYKKISAFLETFDQKKKALEKSMKEVDEMNTTSNVPPINTPFAFSGGTEETDNERTRMGDRCSGFPEKAEKSKNNFESVLDGWLERIEEIAYKDIKKNSSASGRKEVNQAITKVSKLLGEVDKTLTHLMRLKGDKGRTYSDFWKSTKTRINKIDAKIEKIKAKLRGIK